MEQAWEALKKLNVFAEKAGRIALVPWGMMAPGSLESVSSERHQSFAFRHLRHLVGYGSISGHLRDLAIALSSIRSWRCGRLPSTSQLPGSGNGAAGR
jgi:hypothetical protein